MSEIGQKLKNLREKLAISRREIARRAGISYDYLRKIEAGERYPNIALLQRITEALGALFFSDIRDSRSFEPGAAVPAFSLGEGRPVPLIGWTRAGAWDEATDGGFQPGDADEWLYSDRGGGRVFALRVEGRSMEPEFAEGDYILVDPDRQAVEGDYVVARLDDENEATFKQLRRCDGMPVLHPLNPLYADMAIGPDRPVRIVGVVVEGKRIFGSPDPRQAKLSAIIERIRPMSAPDLDRVLAAITLLFEK